MSLAHAVAVVGVGIAKFGDRFEASYEDLAVEAAHKAFADAKLMPDRIDAAVIGTYSPGPRGGKAGTSLADPLRIYGKPISRVENYCATGTDSFRHAVMAVAAGAYECMLVLGVEKMKDRPIRGVPLEGRHPVMGRGLTAPGQFALAANRYMYTFGLTREHLAKVAVKNHANGAKNPLAHLQMEISEEKVLKAPIIAWPFGLFDCCPTTDGAAAAIVMRRDLAQKLRPDSPVVRGLGLAVTSGRPFLDPGFDYLGFTSTQAAAAQAYAMAGIKNPAAEIDVAEVHDCFTWTEITNYEDLGFCKKGQGGDFIREGRSTLAGDLPVNPSGGLKSFGHPIGASGVRMIAEITLQLRGEAAARQVKSPRLGLAHNVGGPGAVACVVVLGAA